MLGGYWGGALGALGVIIALLSAEKLHWSPGRRSATSSIGWVGEAARNVATPLSCRWDVVLVCLRTVRVYMCVWEGGEVLRPLCIPPEDPCERVLDCFFFN